ncbi:MAG: cytochrome b/b6 domain-containing protein [Methanobacteriota archaeon]|nr:MAG: cytochrome b/b6 domain-containing protein [Euryarchaeota archaeon]
MRTPESEKILYWISTIYLWLIVSVIGMMFIHNTLDWIKKIKLIFRERQHPSYSSQPDKIPHRLYLRMTLEERIQHWLLIISFFTLVITGFMLKFPSAWWVLAIRELGGEAIFNIRGVLHRIAAVVMVLDSLYHLYYLFFTRRGREFRKDIRFRLKDISDMIAVFKFNIGLQKEKPKFGRFSYIEKSEYWALIWGTIIMTGTGIALWFENQFMGWFSKLFVDVCETIHYYEAWLAFLAIVVWHFYFVIFNPDVYPMNFAWLSGKLTEEEMEKEHPLELEQLKKADSEEKKLTPELSER